MHLLKNIFILFFALFSTLASAKKYYVSPSGLDGPFPARGTFTHPWKTWHYAFNNVTPSDTVYFRGGVYAPYSSSIGANIATTVIDGTKDNPTCFFAYPDDWADGNYPILDCATMMTESLNNGIEISRAHNLYFKGLTLRNLRQTKPGIANANGIMIWSEYGNDEKIPNNIIFENCVVHNIGGAGFNVANVDSIYFYNCDAYNCIDTLNTSDPGGHGEGWNLSVHEYDQDNADLSYLYFYGCRAWKCSDQGWGASSSGTQVFDHCWSMWNGDTPFNIDYKGVTYTNNIVKGSGWKFWYAYDYMKNSHIRQVIMRNCIAAHNAFIGLNWTDYEETGNYEVRAHVYNNFIYRNGYDMEYKGTPWGFGILDDDEHADTTGHWDHWYWNNISYDNLGYVFWSGNNGDVVDGADNQATNKFDLVGTTITDADFASLDTTGMLGVGTRQSDGSLPVTTFGHLAETSECIDSGTDVGLDYYGAAPDIGAFEYSGKNSGQIPVASVTVLSSQSTSTINTNNGTLQLLVKVLPINATNKTVTWSIVNGTGKATISSSGLVTAISSGTVTARATANDGSGVSGSLLIVINAIPVIKVDCKLSCYSGFVEEIDASGSYDLNNDNLTFIWTIPNNISVSSTTGPIIKYLGPIVNSSQKYEFTLRISDGKSIQSKIIPIEILPYGPELETAEIANIKASKIQVPYYPDNIIDGNFETMWAANGINEWLVVELKNPFEIQHIKLAFKPGQQRESYFNILGSSDHENWEPILVKSASCSFSGNMQAFEFPASKTGKEFKFVKLIGLGNNIDTWNYISEIKILGYKHRNSPSYGVFDIMIYPNPARESVNIRIIEAALLFNFIQLTDFSGKVVYKEDLDPDLREFTIPLKLKNGVYMLQLGTDKLTKFAQKLFVAK